MAPVKSASKTTSRSRLGVENTMYLFLWRLARVEAGEIAQLGAWLYWELTC